MTNHRENLANGAIYHGQWLMTTSTDLARASSAIGFDYVCIDMQHGFARNEDILRLSDAIRAGGDSLVTARVADNRFTEIGMLADAGIEAIIVPLVSNKEQAKAAADALRYPDHGGNRSFGPTAPIVKGDPVNTSDIKPPLLFVMIENAEGFSNAEEICGVEGVDGIYIGPSDLALAVGSTPGPEEQVTTDAIAKVLEIIQGAGKIPGIHCGDGTEANKRREQGFRFITTSSDIAAARTGFINDLKNGRGTND